MRAFLPALSCLFLAACSLNGPQTASAPIVLGDSATIVTETDSKYLKSAFTDFSSATPEKPASAPATETPQPEAVTEKKPQPSGGLSVDFGSIQVFIANLRVRNADLDGKGKTSISYNSDGSVFNPKSMTVAGASRASAKQKTEYQISLNTGDEKLLLSALGRQSTGWQSLSGDGETFNLTTLQDPKLRLNASALQRAAQQALRTAEVDRKTERELLRRIGSLKETDGDLLQAKPVATLWQITTKNTKGKTSTQEIRVDW